MKQVFKLRTRSIKDKALVIDPILGMGELLWMYGDDKELVDDVLLSIADAIVEANMKDTSDSIDSYVFEAMSGCWTESWKVPHNNHNREFPLRTLFVTTEEEDIFDFDIDEMYLQSYGFGIEYIQERDLQGNLWTSTFGQRLLRRINNYDVIIFSSYNQLFEKQHMSPKTTCNFLKEFTDKGKTIIMADRCNKHGSLHKGLYKQHRADMVINIHQVWEDAQGLHRMEVGYEACKIHIAHRFKVLGFDITYQTRITDHAHERMGNNTQAIQRTSNPQR